MIDLVVGAAEFETLPIVETLRPICPEVAPFLIGIGSLEAARRSREVAIRSKGMRVLFVGSCGTLGAFSTPELLIASSVTWMPTCERMGLGYSVPRSSPIALPDPPLWVKGLRSCHVLCSPTVSTQKTANEALPMDAQDAGSYVENLELYSIVGDLLPLVGSLTVLLATTNAVGANAHADWRRHAEGAVALMQRYLLRSLT